MTWSPLSNRVRRINMCSADPNEFAPGSFGIVEKVIDAAMVQRSNFQSRLTERLWRWWGVTSRDGVPRWSSFDITGHSPLAANIYVVRARDDAFQFRLYGERAIEIIGHNPTGQVITSRSPGAISEHLHGGYRDRPLHPRAPMPYKANEPRRHKVPKARYKIANRAEYDAALRRRAVDYGRRSLGEAAMLRYETLIGRSLHARTLPTRKTEAMVACKVISIMAGLGMPVSRRAA